MWDVIRYHSDRLLGLQGRAAGHIEGGEGSRKTVPPTPACRVSRNGYPPPSLFYLPLENLYRYEKLENTANCTFWAWKSRKSPRFRS